MLKLASRTIYDGWTTASYDANDHRRFIQPDTIVPGPARRRDLPRDVTPIGGNYMQFYVWAEGMP